jgi:hypothetical protein
MDRRSVPLAWVERAHALLLVAAGLYILAIGQLSPHPLPGIRGFALSVLAAGLLAALRSAGLRRAAMVTLCVAVACGALGIGDIAVQGRRTSEASR